MTLEEYIIQIKLAIALADDTGYDILINRFLVDDCGVIRKNFEGSKTYGND